MRLKIQLLHLLLMLCCSYKAIGDEKKIFFAGKITDNITNESIPFAEVRIKELDRWTISNEKGEFQFYDLPIGIYTVLTNSLNYKQFQQSIVLMTDLISYSITLSQRSLSLDEVIVTAKQDHKYLNSTSLIRKTALDHLQCSSLSDMLQLLPGMITTNPDLSTINYVVLRDLSNRNMEASLGTAILIDGIKFFNDANLQISSPYSFQQDYNTTSGAGADVRLIAVDNIESIEVMRGVLSAEYGDMSSGAILVRTKSGQFPWQAKVKVDPFLKSLSLSKGKQLSSRGNFLNFDIEYVRSISDPRTNVQTFDRLIFQLGYSQNGSLLNRKFTYTAKWRGAFGKSEQKNDPDFQVEELCQAKEKQFNFNFYGNWMLNQKWITNLKYNFSISYNHQLNREKKWHSSVRVSHTTATETGEHIGRLMEHQYFSDLKIDGKPLYVHGKLIGQTNITFPNGINRILSGVEYNLKGNRGKGKTFDQSFSPYQNLRPRSYEDIPIINEYIVFIEDHFRLKKRFLTCELTAGIRCTHLDAPRYHFNLIADPRINTRLIMYENTKTGEFLKHLSIRGGWGILHKQPTLLSLYPEASYHDNQSFIYNDEKTNTSLVVMTTHKFLTENPSLKIARSYNQEIGLDVEIRDKQLSIVYFHEQLRDGYAFYQQTKPIFYRSYDLLTSGGLNPEYRDGDIWLDDKTHSYRVKNSFASFTTPNNGIRVDKWGIEYILDLGKIPSLFTAFYLDGAYLNIKRWNEGLQMDYKDMQISGKNNPYVGIYVGTSGSSNGRRSERLNTNFRFITHIPKIHFIVTTTLQCIWLDRSRRIADFRNSSLVYMKDANGNRIETDPYKDNIHAKFINPIAFMDLKGNVFPFTALQESDPSFQSLIKQMLPTFYQQDSYKPYCMLNIRLTKEIGKRARLAFYANNLFNSHPRRFSSSTHTYIRLNSELSYGAELSIQLKK